MKKVLLFDWDGPAFDPWGTGRLYPDVARSFAELAQVPGLIMFVLTAGEEANQRKKIGSLAHYFKEVWVVPKPEDKRKKLHDIMQHQDFRDTSPRNIIVVGDRIYHEILYANQEWKGCQTVWVQRGRYIVETPRVNDENPTHVVGSLLELLSMFLKDKI